ncbi:hypothetical protein BDF21DRAFT_332681, partial [Thamnidium elegans]
TQVIIESPSAKEASYTIIGAVSAFGVMNAGIREPKTVKKRKVVGDSKREAPRDAASTIPKGTIAGHYSKFINVTLDIIGVFPHIKSFYIVMDNAPIHNSDLVDPVIIERGYIPV